MGESVVVCYRKGIIIMMKVQKAASLAKVSQGMTNEEIDLIVNKVILGLPTKFIAEEMCREVKLIEDIK